MKPFQLLSVATAILASFTVLAQQTIINADAYIDVSKGKTINNVSVLVEVRILMTLITDSHQL